jgi:hypothetical protein
MGGWEVGGRKKGRKEENNAYMGSGWSQIVDDTDLQNPKNFHNI